MSGSAAPSRPPTSDECSANAYIAEFDAYATWYPQMGGYSSKCWIIFDDNGAALGERSNAAMLPGGCFEAWIYHDGTFPFDSKTIFDPEWGKERPRKPARIHHCSSEQFVDFGKKIREFEIKRQRGSTK